jgi:hypothetical protein
MLHSGGQPEDEIDNRKRISDFDWIGVACGVSFLATVASSVTCFSAALLSRFKMRKTEMEKNGEQPGANRTTQAG